MHALLAAALAGSVTFAQQIPAPQADPTLKAPDCQTLMMTNAPGILQLCQGEAAMRRAEAAAGDENERRKHLTAAVAEFERAASSLRELDLKVYAVEALARVFDDTHLNEPREVEQALRSLITLMPGSSSPLRRIAALQEAQGLVDAAENTLLSAKQQAPEDVEVYRALSQFYAKRAAQLSADTAEVQPHGEPRARGSAPDAEGYYKIGGDIPPPAPTTPRVAPPRPPEAEAAGAGGAVILEIRVDETGSVSDAKILRSIPLLDEAALAAVRQWRYEPTIVDGRPVPVKMTVTVDFGRPAK
jgi:TonB family protein